MEFVTKRLVIRPIRHRDCSQLLPLLNLPQVKAFNDYGDNLTEVDLKCMIQMDIERLYERIGGRFCLICKKSNTIIGCVGFYLEHEEPDGIYVGYELSPEYWGSGLMFEALSHLFKQAKQLPFACSTVIARVSPKNHRSLNLLSRLGFCCGSDGLYRISL
ncbi:GNAT family N-acetyltransferase [Pseudoalteromonas sp. McH1-7]|uniref:GNAT family N-acetyltransferase n=1 Tax=Pseudoalteromonas sp. McH1-7 TaxID=2745574 RepID=UPI00158FEA4E|nr:GNAT family N-acetyltransferase [Pseudoalteromonas sp. McH1-7]NUZ09265.1 GNAT family N-acetyltransferase [Pseudoalteromonas sp. McH1-7]